VADLFALGFDDSLKMYFFNDILIKRIISRHPWVLQMAP